MSVLRRVWSIKKKGDKYATSEFRVCLQLCEKDETIRRLAMYVDETQEQYNECFTEASFVAGRLFVYRKKKIKLNYGVPLDASQSIVLIN